MSGRRPTLRALAQCSKGANINMKAFVISVLLLTSGLAMAADGSCRSTAGAQKSAELVRQCKAISEATHPPCSAANPCDMMVEEITR